MKPEQFLSLDEVEGCTSNASWLRNGNNLSRGAEILGRHAPQTLYNNMAAIRLSRREAVTQTVSCVAT